VAVRVVGLSALLVASLVLPSFAQEANPPLEGDLDTIRAEVDAFIADAQTELESGRFDDLQPTAIAARADGDPERLLEWVADNTLWAPYLGSLRGSSAVLVDGSGNSLDRSLLLAGLLSDSGVPARLARARLSDELASGIVESQTQRWADAAAARDAELPPEGLVVRDRIADTARELEDAVALTPATVPSPADMALDAARDHWWVQFEGDGGWSDLDPLLADDVRPQADATFEPGAIPDDLRHRVIVRVVIERSDEVGREELVPLEYELPVGDSSGFETLRLSFWPGGPLDLGPVDSLEAAAESMTHWLPALQTGSDTITGEWFSNAGLLEPAPALAQGEALSSGVEGLAGLGGSDEAEPPSSVLSGVWLETEVLSPGQEPRRERRELYDLVGPAGRAAGEPVAIVLEPEQERSRGVALLGSTSVLMAPGFVSPLALEHQYLRDLVDSRNAMIALALAAAGSDDERIDPALQQAPVTDLQLWVMSAARRWWSPVADKVFLGSPNVWTRHDLLDEADPDAGGSSHVDIVVNDVRVFEADGELSPQSARLQQGVADTFVEYEISGGLDHSNTFARYADRQNGASEWQILRPDDGAASLPLAGISSDEDSRLRAALADGFLVVVGAPEQAADDSAEWWRVDPVTGATLGIGERGWGQITIEEFYSRLAAYDRAAARSIQVRSLCGKWVLGLIAAQRVAVYAAIASGGSPYPPPVVRVCM